jgi:hypothetical protein
MSWHHPSVIIACITVAFILGYLARDLGRRRDYLQGYRDGREDESRADKKPPTAN